MLDINFLSEQAGKLKLGALLLTEGLRSGNIKSVFRGQGIEFDEVREYEYGDDTRLIDWNITARMNRPYVKRYREERELTVFLVVDCSASMGTGYGPVSRREQSWNTVSLIAFAAELTNNPVGAVFFDGKAGRAFVPKTGSKYVMTILGNMVKTRSHFPGSDLASVLRGTQKILKRRSLVVIVSDFRMNNYQEEMEKLGRKHDVMAVRITDPADYSLPEGGLIPFWDPETNQKSFIPTLSGIIRKKWQGENRQIIQNWEYICKSAGVVPLSISTENDAVKELIKVFSNFRKIKASKS